MSESTGQTLETVPVVASTVTATDPKPRNRLYQAAAWVAIVAGTLFIIAVIFFTGFVLGRHSDGPGRFDRHHPWRHSMMDRDAMVVRRGLRECTAVAQP
jgi:hypothetical protein